MSKRGQAAMEFLMTYGWAILAAIIAIGVLAYFGVFTPGKYVGSSAIVTAPFYANAWAISAAGGGTVTLELRNNGGETLNVSSVAIVVTDPQGITCTPDTGVGSVSSNALSTATLTSCTGINVGDTFRGDITISYRKSGSAVTLISTGTITDKVAA